MDSRKDRPTAPAKLLDSPHTQPRLDVRESLQRKGHRVFAREDGPTGHTGRPSNSGGTTEQDAGAADCTFLSSQQVTTF